MSRTAFLLLAAFALVPRLPAAAAEAPHPAACATTPALVAAGHALPHLASALRPGGHLEVLALGSGTLLGPRGGVEGSLPDLMAASLRTQVPGLAVHLTLQAARASTAVDMLGELRRELVAHPYQLVLWQTGTVEAVRKLPPAQFRQTLADGTDAAAAAGADTVLIDVPYSRLLDSNTDSEPYRRIMQEMDARPGLVLFRRYDLMRHWAESGEIDLEEAGKRERKHTADMLRRCLGEALAQLLLEARGGDAGP